MRRKQYKPKPVKVPTIIRTAFVFTEVEGILRDIDNGEVLIDSEGVIVRLRNGSTYDVVPTLSVLTDALGVINSRMGWDLPCQSFDDLARVLWHSDEIPESKLRACKHELARWRAEIPRVPPEVISEVAAYQAAEVARRMGSAPQPDDDRCVQPA